MARMVSTKAAMAIPGMLVVAMLVLALGLAALNARTGDVGGERPRVLGVQATKAGDAPKKTKTRPADSHVFVVSGDGPMLAPGVDRSLAVRVQNPHNFPIRVTKLSVRVSGDKACPGGNVVVGTFPVPFDVAARGVVVSNLPMRLAATAGNGCKDRTFALTYSGSAVKR